MLKVGDMVFIKHTKLMQGELINFNNFNLNEPYSIDNCTDNYVQFYNCTTRFNKDHVKLIEGDEIRGTNIFRVGSIIECINIEPIKWDQDFEDTKLELKKLLIGEKYEVTRYIYCDGDSYIKIRKGNYNSDFIHSNHFKKC